MRKNCLSLVSLAFLICHAFTYIYMRHLRTEATYDPPRNWPEFWHKTKDAEYERDRKDRQDLTNQSYVSLVTTMFQS